MKKYFLFFIISLLVVETAIAVTTASFSVSSEHTGLAGSNAQTSSFNFSSTTTHQQPSDSNIITSSFSLRSNWFTVTTQSTAGATILGVLCSNDTLNYFNCSDMDYNTNITHIRAECTGSVSDVRYTLTNLEDSTNYINNVTYSYSSSSYYYYNSSYVLQDSGNWTLSILCIGSTTDISSTQWLLPWGWLNISLVQPLIDASVQVYKMFTFQTTVSCIGGECGTVNVTLDPHQVGEDNNSNITNKSNFVDHEDLSEQKNESNITVVSQTDNETFGNKTNITINVEKNVTVTSDEIVNKTDGTLNNTVPQVLTNLSRDLNNTINISIDNQTENLHILNKTHLIAAYGFESTIELVKDVQIKHQSVVLSEDQELNINPITPILAIELEEESGAIVTLPKLDPDTITIIQKCDNWNFFTDQCDSIWYILDTVIEQDDTKVWFTVDSFSAYLGGNATVDEETYMVIWDENDLSMPNASQNRVVDEQVLFFADYKISSNGTKITDANCTLTVNSTIMIMDYNNSYQAYAANTSFSASGLYSYTINCSHSSYQSLEGTDVVSIPEAATKFGAVSTVVGAAPFYTISLNPQNCTILRAGDSCTSSWQVNTTGSIGSTHEFFTIYNMTSNTNYVSDNVSQSLNLTISANDTTNPTILAVSLSSSIFYPGQSVGIFVTSNDNVQVDQCWATITLPNTTTVSVLNLCTAQQSYITEIIGVHSMIIYINDTSNNLANSSTSFSVSDQINFTGAVNRTNASLYTNVSFYYGSSIYQSQTVNGSYNATLPHHYYDVEFRTNSNKVQVLLRNVNVSTESEKTVHIDKLDTAATGYLGTYGISGNYSFTNVTVTLYYDDLAVTDESNLRLYECSSWSVYTKACLGSWTDITSVASKDTVNNYFAVTRTALQAYSIKQYVAPVAPSGGGGGSGGSGAVIPSANTVPVAQIAWQAVSSSETINWELENVELPIKILSFTAKELLNQVSAKVKSLDSLPEEILPPSADDLSGVFSYLEISLNNRVGAKTLSVDSSQLSQVTIEFSVDISWLTDNGYDQDSVKLLRYTDHWVELDTAFMEQKGSKLYFKATSPGFSYFAIRATKPRITYETTTTVASITTTTTYQTTTTERQSVVGESVGQADITQESQFSIGFVSLGILIILLVIGGWGAFLLFNPKQVIEKKTSKKSSKKKPKKQDIEEIMQQLDELSKGLK